MEDSRTMTIDYLRARLLSERSVSRSARQRADELAKRVTELEEQLKIVSLQRKRAEKATVDVLAILENQGLSDVSEEYDLSSDQETPYESKVGNNSTKEEDSSINSKVSRNKSEEFSGSDLDSSPVRGRSLSWKGRNDSPRSLQKYKNSSMRRSSVTSTRSFSPKHSVGKSCRRIRRSEAGSIVEDFKTEPVKGGCEENGVATHSEGFTICTDGGLKEGSKIQENVLLDGALPGFLENQKNVGNNGLDCNEYGGDKDMEKALEDQAQLIGRYEAMEKAQREWEEKFRENNSSTPDSFDPGNHSDTTEERDEVNPQAPYPAETVASNAQDEVKPQAPYTTEATGVGFSKELPKTKPNGVPPPLHMGGTQNQNASSSFASEPVAQESALPTNKWKQNQESVGRHQPSFSSHHEPHSGRHQPSFSFHHEPHSRGSPGNQLAHSSSSDVGSSFQKGNSSASRNDLYALVPHGPSDGLGSVLEALKQARVSLEQKMNRVPLIEGASVGKAVEPSVPATNTGNSMEIPVGYAGLFRLPTDYLIEASTQAEFLGSGSGSGTSNYALTAGDRIGTSPYFETRSSISTSDPYLPSQYGTTLSRVYTERPQFDSYLDTIKSSSSRYTNPTYPTYPVNATYPSYRSYPELLPQMPSNEGFPRSFSSRAVGVPPAPADNYFYDDHIRPNMYR
ncbi:uncharacterized protein LOC132186616 isoform X2 [Corylus avellana]|nr:uncharacterized protein LOC132186616 isoform X2 [Corylus avellana]